MFTLLRDWYTNKFSDPDAAVLLALIITCSLVLMVWGGILAPVLVAVVLSYLLDWPVTQLQKKGYSRSFGTTIALILFMGVCVWLFLVVFPAVWAQSSRLAGDLPDILARLQQWLLTLPEQYPSYVDSQQIQSLLNAMSNQILSVGEYALSASLASLFSVAALLLYFILVPLMMFFMLKDKQELLDNVSSLLPKERKMINKVGNEMNVQITNYIRGKVLEILIVGTVSVITFWLLGLQYALLLGILVGLSVLIPYVGAALVTIPVLAVALVQFGLGSEFWYIFIAYSIIQALDGNLLVPLLFSEAVSLHPLYIIIAVLFFGGLWGFWGVFFAIPLATLVKAVLSAWDDPQVEEGASQE